MLHMAMVVIGAGVGIWLYNEIKMFFLDRDIQQTNKALDKATDTVMKQYDVVEEARLKAERSYNEYQSLKNSANDKPDTDDKSGK